MASCPVCAGSAAVEILSLPALPVAINAQTSPEEALSVDRGDLDLVACTSCSHFYNASFDPEASSYDSSYENSLHFSAHFRDHAQRLATRLVEDHGLVGETVAEAGSGPGHFLTMLCEAGVDRAYGFDPSYDPARAEAPNHPAVQLSSAPFPVDGSIEPTLALTQHVLEHLARPVDLLRDLRSAVEGRPRGTVYSEVPNGGQMVERGALWDLIYEHVSYFTPVSLGHALARAGLSADRLFTLFDDQFLAAESSPTEVSEALPAPPTVEPLVERAVRFGQQVRQAIDRARSDLERYGQRGPVALWGAGSKGMTYLNLVAPGGEMGAIVDVNPRKAGFGIPGVPGAIQGPDVLAELRPATVLVANPIYTDEIRHQLVALGVDAEVAALWG